MKVDFGRLLAAVTWVPLLIAMTWPSNALAEHPSFKKDIFPVIEVKCLDCHRPGGKGFEKSGFDMRTYEGLMKGTKFGPMVVPGNAYLSNLMVLIEGRANRALKMPHDRREEVTKRERHLFRVWINRGAKDN